MSKAHQHALRRRVDIGVADHVYRHRDAMLERMGFDGYAAYLRSPLWAEIKARFYAGIASLDCYGCGNPTAEKRRHVHHTGYTEALLRGEILIGLVLLCPRCHGRAEKMGGMKTDTARAGKILQRQRRRRGLPVFCPVCDVNRAMNGGPCPPCLRQQATA